jgi:hypothetical protein
MVVVERKGGKRTIRLVLILVIHAFFKLRYQVNGHDITCSQFPLRDDVNIGAGLIRSNQWTLSGHQERNIRKFLSFQGDPGVRDTYKYPGAGSRGEKSLFPRWPSHTIQGECPP